MCVYVSFHERIVCESLGVGENSVLEKPVWLVCRKTRVVREDRVEQKAGGEDQDSCKPC